MAVTATFSPAAGILTAIGDTLSRNAAGNLLLNGGAVSIVGGKATVANTARVQVFGLAGNDIIGLDESNGALPAADLFGGSGNDTLTGGSGADQLFGQVRHRRGGQIAGDDGVGRMGRLPFGDEFTAELARQGTVVTNTAVDVKDACHDVITFRVGSDCNHHRTSLISMKLGKFKSYLSIYSISQQR